MSVHRSSVLAASILLALATGCRDGMGPGEIEGTYVLEQGGDDPIPWVIFRDERAVVRIVADTLRLGANGLGTIARGQLIQLVDAGSTPPTSTRIAGTVSYTVTGSQIEISYLCHPFADCIAGPHLVARRNRGGFLIREPLLGEDEHFYRRLRPLEEMRAR